jgi:predicted DNA-binding transcriptional regulator AlpA
MTVSFVSPSPTSAVAAKRRNGNAKPLPINNISLDQPDARLRIGHLLTLLAITAPTLYKRVKAGLLPAQDGVDPRPYWKAKTIKAFLEGQQSASKSSGATHHV